MKRLLIILAVAAVVYGSDNQTLEENQPQQIITNGYRAPEGKAPYIVGLLLGKDNVRRESVCSGIIIANNWVLTARHCLAGPDFAEIHYGSNQGWKGQLSHKVNKQNFILHENRRHDIGLIRTPHVDFTARINKISLPKLSQKSESFVGRWALACGWGTMANGKLADWLQCIDAQIISNRECRRTYRSLGDHELCTSTRGGKATCGGDSGGPLVTRDNPILVGITAFGVAGSCTTGHPDGFTRVTSHLDWIRAKTGVVYN